MVSNPFSACPVCDRDRGGASADPHDHGRHGHGRAGGRDAQDAHDLSA